MIGDDYATWTALVGGTALAGRVSRAEAIRVPSVQRARNLIAGTLGSMPLHAVNSSGEQVAHPLLTQPESLKGLVRCVTLTRTVEDLLYEGSSLWLVVLRTSAGFPQTVERVEHGQWTQDADTAVIQVRGREVSTEDVILFTSPCDPLLIAGASAIRNLIRLEATAAMYAEDIEPTSYFTPRDGLPDPEDPAEIESFLDDWKAARQKRATAYVPSGVTLHSVQRQTAEEAQLSKAREFAVTEVARLTGIDADWLSVNTTSRTYLNGQDARRAFVDFTLAPFMHAVEERLSLGDTTPRGQRTLFNANSFLRASTLERYQAHKTAIESGFLSIAEVRDLEDRPPLEDAA